MLTKEEWIAFKITEDGFREQWINNVHKVLSDTWDASLKAKVAQNSTSTNRPIVKFTYVNESWYTGYKCDQPGNMSGEYIKVR